MEKELDDEVEAAGVASVLDHLRLCGAIPESYGHDTSEEKLYSKYADVLLAIAFHAIGMTAAVFTQRADTADVEVAAQAISSDVCIMSYSHLAVLVSYAEAAGQEAARRCSWLSWRRSLR